MEFFQGLQVAAITAAVPVLVYYLVSYVRSKIVAAIQGIDHAVIADTLTKATDIVLQAVMTVSQTYVDSLKQHGEFSNAAKREAYNRAREYILTLLNSEAKELLGEVFGSLDVWIETMIESTVSSLKPAGQEYMASVRMDEE